MSSQRSGGNRGGDGYAARSRPDFGTESDDGAPEGQQRASRNFVYPLRPVPQQRQPTGFSGRGDNGTPTSDRVRRPAPPPPMSSMPRSGDRTGPQRHPGPQYVSTDSETDAQPSVAYHSGQQPVRPQPRYPSSAEGDDSTSLGAHPSVKSDRSVYVGFDSPDDPPNSNALSAIPNFPAPTTNQLRLPPPSSRRAAPPYYSQQTIQVSPIPEESVSSRHGSYASSAAIPSNWDDFESSSGLDNLTMQDDGGPGLVRQASLGRKTRPTLTNIKSPRTPSRSPSESGKGTSRETPTRNSSTVSTMSAGSILRLAGGPAQSPVSPRSVNSSPLSRPPVAAVQDVDDKYAPKNLPTYSKRPDTQLSLAVAKELGFPAGADNSHGSTRQPNKFVNDDAGTGRVPGRRLPPRLNIDAVREAEARGSLTSLPDLIRRATKLAAVLETERPGSQAWGGRGSFFGISNKSSGRSNAKDTDSISDILASFPPPMAHTRNGVLPQRMSEWPIPEDDGHSDNGSILPVKTGRRICGLPLWVFIVLVVLALVVTTAAVVVTLQLVDLSKSNNDGGGKSSTAAQCKESHPCQNGGENIAINDFCGCICTNGFTGASCAQKESEDSSCTIFDFDDRKSSDDVTKGIKNATIGSALPRLFDKAERAYNIELDPSLLLGIFSKSDLSCTLQNALVNFNGKTQPGEERKRRSIQRRQKLVLDGASTLQVPTATATSSESTATPTSFGEIELDQDALDFARVAVLYLVQRESVDVAENAHQTLDRAFRDGMDFGNITAGEFTFHLDDRSILVPETGEVVGGTNRVVV